MIRKFAFLLAAVFLSLSGCSEGSKKDQRPHVVLISAGDLSPADLSLYGGPVKTPNIDRIGKRGVTFDRAYAASSLAAPARAGLITGQYPQRFGFMYELGTVRQTVRDRIGLSDTVRTVQERLQEFGYETALFGSWQLGADEPYYPMLHGFDFFWGTLGPSTAYTQPRRADTVFAASPRFRLPPSRSLFDSIFTGITAADIDNIDDYLTDDMGDEVVSYLDTFFTALRRGQTESEQAAQDDAAPDKLFLWASFHAPRGPLTALERDMNALPESAPKERRVYAAMIKALDRNVGKILDKLEDEGAIDETLIIFTADRGCNGLAGTCPCGGLRGGAYSLREGGIRVPLAVSFPKALQANTRSQTPVISLDVTATIVEMTDPVGRLVPEIEGHSLSKLAAGNASKFKNRFLFWEQSPLEAVMQGDKKLYRDGDGLKALYDLSSDPGETVNLAREDGFAVTTFETEMDVWKQLNRFPDWRKGKYTEAAVCENTDFVVR